MAENREITLFSEPEELIAWAEVYDKQINPSIEDAALLLNYMEGHDYAIGMDAEGKMYRQDMAEENGEIEPFPIDDVIDKVCEWNYDLILHAEAMVLCQYLVQVKMRNFSHFNPPKAQPQCVFFYTIVRIHLVTYSYNGYEFVSYCRKLPDIRKSSSMPACNREF